MIRTIVIAGIMLFAPVADGLARDKAVTLEPALVQALERTLSAPVQALKGFSLSDGWGACGYVTTGGVRRPFMATALRKNNPARWMLKIGTNRNTVYSAYATCATFGAPFEGWEKVVNPSPVGATSGNTGNVRLSAEQRALVEKSVGRELRLFGKSRITGLMASRRPYKGTPITWACGTAVSGRKGVPFMGVFMEKHASSPASFTVTGHGGDALDNWTTFDSCKESGMSFSIPF
ncbi:hypothetical protein C8J38_102470 [Rhizobium sp. PP-WC-2G-219]|nr:hypothetical protein C8J38_102470 [Rhizobium sp. PP-WC-2G-219]